MFERYADIVTNHSAVRALTVCPDEGGQYPLVIFYMDAPGYREELENMARQIAKAGYFVILPDLYYRLGTVRFNLPRREETMSAVIKACIAHVMNRAQIIDDTGAVIAWADAQAQVKPGPVGLVGYCMGGPFITWAAAHFRDRVKAAASLYGTRMVNDLEQSPHRWVGQVEAELYYGFASNDTAAPPEVIETFTQAMVDAGVKHRVEIHEDTRHGFCFPARGAYSPAAAERVWERLFDLFQRNLR